MRMSVRTLGHVVSHAVQIRRVDRAMAPGKASRPLKVSDLCFQRMALSLKRSSKGITRRDASYHRSSFYGSSSSG